MIPDAIKVHECHLLRRVLGVDKLEVLPKACKVSQTSNTVNPTATKPFMTRMVSPPAPNGEFAGKVTLGECSLLNDTLKLVPGGSTFIPSSCSAMIKSEEKRTGELFEDQNARVYSNLKRRNTFVAINDFPPTAT